MEVKKVVTSEVINTIETSISDLKKADFSVLTEAGKAKISKQLDKATELLKNLKK